MPAQVSAKNIFKCIHKEDINRLKTIMALKDFNPNEVILKSSQDSGLHMAVRTGNYSLVVFLLDNQFDKFLEHQNNDGKRPLHEAAQLCFQEIVELLLNKGAKIDPLKRADWTPLMLAASKGHLGIIRQLVEAGSCMHLANKDGWTAFHIACRNGDPDVVEYLLALETGCWNSKSKNGRTPLHTAALHGNTKIVEILLEKGDYTADEMDSCGNTPLMEAVRSGHLDCVSLLLSKTAASLSKEDCMGRIAIHVAAEAGQTQIVRSLIEDNDVDVNAPSRNGQTPLHFAAKENHVDTINFLCSIGADPNLPDSRGRTALWMCATSKNSESYRILKSFGAEDIDDSKGDTLSSLSEVVTLSERLKQES